MRSPLWIAATALGAIALAACGSGGSYSSPAGAANTVSPTTVATVDGRGLEPSRGPRRQGVLGRGASRRLVPVEGRKWPLYRYAGDAKAGDTNGQGSGGVWFAVTPSGALHKS